MRWKSLQVLSPERWHCKLPPLTASKTLHGSRQGWSHAPHINLTSTVKFLVLRLNTDVFHIQSLDSKPSRGLNLFLILYLQNSSLGFSKPTLWQTCYNTKWSLFCYVSSIILASHLRIGCNVLPGLRNFPPALTNKQLGPRVAAVKNTEPSSQILG